MESMDKKTQNLIIRKMRNTTRFWHISNNVRKAAKTRIVIGYFKNGKRKYKVMYKCAHCTTLQEKIEIDHIDEVGPFKGCWDIWMNRLFCEESNLQALCRGCHQVKTDEYNEFRKTGGVFL